MDLLIIRHGQSEADLLHVIEGRADFALTALGQRQADRMARWVSGYMAIDAILSSPLARARQTAQALSAATRIPVTLDNDLMEWQNGLIAGLTRQEADRRYPLPEPRHPHTALYGQESMIAFRARAETALSRILCESPQDAKVAVVSHGGTINLLYRCFLGLPMNAETTFNTGDTGIHHWRLSGDGRRVVFANRLAHLEGL